MTRFPHIALNFHGIGTPPAGIDADERPYWLPVARFEQIVARVALDPRPARFVFTFDDGNASDLEAAEVLQRHGLKGRFFVLAGRLSKPGYLSPADLRALAARGMTVGLHGRHHVDWRSLDDAGLADETGAARAEIAEAVGQPVDEVAIPFGAYNLRVIEHLAGQGFRRILTSDSGPFDPHALIWNRNSLRSDMSAEAIDAIFQARAPLAGRLRQALSRIVRRGFH